MNQAFVARLRVKNSNKTKKQKRAYKKMLIEQILQVISAQLYKDDSLCKLSEKVITPGRKDGEKELSMIIVIQTNKPIPGGIEINQKLDRILTNQTVLAKMIEETKETP